MKNKIKVGTLRSNAIFRAMLTIALCVGLSGFFDSALAKPPPWAPAHGYRNKHKVKPAKTKVAVAPLDISIGRCNRDVIGATIGGVAGGVIGSKLGKGDGKTLATIGGTLVGIFVGQAIGRQLDEADRSCMEQTLEQAPNNRSIRWRNPDESTDYSFTPTNDFMTQDRRRCRDYLSTINTGNRSRALRGTACRDDEGHWVTEN